MSTRRSLHGMSRVFRHCNQTRITSALCQQGFPRLLGYFPATGKEDVSNKKATLACRDSHFRNCFSRNLCVPLRFPLLNTYSPGKKVSFTPFVSSPLTRNMSTLHLAKGSACPPLQEGKVRLYNMKYCPFAQRALLVAHAKGIPHDIVNCNLKDKAEWLLAKNPEGKVPVLETADGKILYESLIVSDYLDEVYSNRSLHSKDPYQKSIDRIFIEKFGSVVSLFYKILFAIRDGQAEVIKEALSNFVQGLKPFEDELARRGTVFFGGDKPGMVDYMIWPWIERIPLIKNKVPDLFDFEGAKKQNPTLENWRQEMKKDPTVLEFLISCDLHQQFVDSFMAGSPNYDL